MANITAGENTIRTAAAGGSLGGLANASDLADTIGGLEGDDRMGAGGGIDTITPDQSHHRRHGRAPK